MPPGTIRVRFLGSEAYAYPADPNRMPIPLYGEQVLCVSMAAGASETSGVHTWYYTSIVNTHGNVNNAVLPFLQDKTIAGTNYGANPIVKSGIGMSPSQLSFKEQDIVYIQPFQGDINFPDRFGSILRFSSTHMKQDILMYKQKPFWTGMKKGDPIVMLTCGVKEARDGGSANKYYAIEDPDKDDAFIYLTSSQKFNGFKLAQKNIGSAVKKLNLYDKPQVIIGSDRLVFNARKDEILLIAKKDVKIVTKSWHSDMDEFFDQVLKLIEEVIDQNKNLEAAHKEIGKVAQSNATSIHPTGVGPSGPPLNAAAFVASKGKSVANGMKTKSIRKKVEKIKGIIKKMKG